MNIVREGERLATYSVSPGGSFVQAIDTPAIDDTGGITFGMTTYVSDPAVTDGYAVYTYKSGGYQLVAQSGGQGPAALPGATFSLVQGPRVNSAGDVVFQGIVSGPGISSENDFGLWRASAAEFKLLPARETNNLAHNLVMILASANSFPGRCGRWRGRLPRNDDWLECFFHPRRRTFDLAQWRHPANCDLKATIPTVLDCRPAFNSIRSAIWPSTRPAW